MHHASPDLQGLAIDQSLPFDVRAGTIVHKEGQSDSIYANCNRLSSMWQVACSQASTVLGGSRRGPWGSSSTA